MLSLPHRHPAARQLRALLSHADMCSLAAAALLMDARDTAAARHQTNDTQLESTVALELCPDVCGELS